jgi:glucosamine--fructose-6-phosphate aminotransferase (isomerizing)
MKQPITYQEIIGQPAAWQQAIEVVEAQTQALSDLWNSGKHDGILFSGCGSTYYLSLAGASLFRAVTGKPAWGVPSGELLMYPDVHYLPGAKNLLFAISRSAETSETILAVERFRRDGRGASISVSNYADRPLSDTGAVNLIIPAGQEVSVAQTKSFASMYVATVAAACVMAGRQDLLAAMHHLPEVGQRLLDSYEALARGWGENLALDRFYFLGSGLRYGLASELSLKMKEMTLSHSEPFHFLEFRHGPKSMVTESALVIGFLSEQNRKPEADVLAEMRKLGGNVLSLSESEADVNFTSGIPEVVRNVLYLPVLQLMAYYRSLAKGLNPDHPNNLDSVVKLSWD